MNKKPASPKPEGNGALPIRCSHSALVALSELKAHPQNPNTHSERQIELLAKVIKHQGWRSPVTVSNRGGFIVAGHGRFAAAKLLGVERVPCDFQDFESEADEQAHLVADNRIAELADLDLSSLSTLLTELKPKLADFELTGFTQTDFSKILAGLAQAQSAGEKVFTDEQIAAAAFKHFREIGFPYRKLPLHVCQQEINRLATTPTERLLHSDLGYQVADTYHPHRFHSSANGMRSPFDSFEDDKQLKRAIRLSLEFEQTIPEGYFGTLSLVAGTQACSNFRPGFALALYRRFCKPSSVILDTSTGYGGRLIGFMASGCAQYVGIDPNTETHKSNLRMAAELGFSERVKLINKPAEDVDPASLFYSCDFAFTSPPYFAKEIYSDEPTQSCNRYTTGEAWRDKFLFPLMRLQFAALKKKSRAVVNIADVKLKSQTYPLAQWTIDAAKAAGFSHEGTEQFEFAHRFGQGEGGSEPVLIFRKP